MQINEKKINLYDHLNKSTYTYTNKSTYTNQDHKQLAIDSFWYIHARPPMHSIYLKKQWDFRPRLPSYDI